MGVLPARLAVALHVLFPPFHRLPFFTACCLKDGLPPSTMKRGHKKNNKLRSVFKTGLANAAPSRTADIKQPRPFAIQTCVTESAGRQWLKKMCFSSLRMELFFYFFAVYKVTDRVENISSVIMLLFFLSKLFSPADITPAPLVPKQGCTQTEGDSNLLLGHPLRPARGHMCANTNIS